ncbi:RICIN domain-containing protein [Hyalangium versicolor]|uniref:RICIN domain-containing protein n=1 Tax=Hyalangium versicolor TaxID=2861190 RepID=UPI001CCF8AE6|nr:RICIN domain-containing protein [Hyalangium versicolor]
MNRMLSVAVAAVVALGFGTTARAESTSLVITRKDSPQVLTLGGGPEGKDGAAVVLSPNQALPGQNFSLEPVGKPEDQTFNIVSSLNKLCVDVKGGSTEDGAEIIQKQCNGATCQVFRVSDRGPDGHRELRNELSGKCMAVGKDFALVQVTCNGKDDQRFRISPPRKN